MRTPFEQRIFNSYRNMRMVCFSENHEQHLRAIRDGVDLQLDFNGYKDLANWVLNKLGPPPDEDAQLIRKNQYKGFTRTNLEWGYHQDVGPRYRYCIKLKYKGKTQTLAEWARDLDIPYGKLHRRYHWGMNPREILTLKNRT